MSLTQDISILITGIRSLQDRPKTLEPRPLDSSDFPGEGASLGELAPDDSSFGMIRDSRPNKRSSSLYISDRLYMCSSSPFNRSDKRVSEWERSESNNYRSNDWILGVHMFRTGAPSEISLGT